MDSGSRSYTSMPAANRRPSCSASASAASSTTGPRGVHEDRGRLQQRESACVDQVRGLGPQWHVQADDVGRPEQRVEIRGPAWEAGVVAGVVQHRHPETAGAPGDGPADPPVAHDPQRGAVYVGTEILRDGPARPAVGPEVALGLGREP